MAADSSGVAFRYVEESSWGVTPSAALQILRMTGEDFAGIKKTIVSDELVGDAQVTDVIEAGYSSAGTLKGNLSFGTYDEFMSAAIRSVDFAAETAVTAATIAATATQLTDSGNGLAAFTAGQFVKASGFTATSLNRVYLVTAVAAGALSVYPDPATTESTGQSVTISGADIYNGVARRSFSFEREHTDLSSIFSNWVGCRSGGMALDFKAEDRVTVSFPFMGKTEAVAGATIGTGSPTAATSTKMMNAVGHLVIMGEGTTHADITVLSGGFKIDNPLRNQPVAGSTAAVGIGVSTVKAEGTITLYFADNTLKTKWLAHTQSALAFAFQDTAGNAYGFYFPAVQFQDVKNETPGMDTDIVLSATWHAFKDATTGYTVHMTKMAA